MKESLGLGEGETKALEKPIKIYSSPSHVLLGALHASRLQARNSGRRVKRQPFRYAILHHHLCLFVSTSDILCEEPFLEGHTPFVVVFQDPHFGGAQLFGASHPVNLSESELMGVRCDEDY